MSSFSLLFSTDPATTALSTLSLHDALPISAEMRPIPPATLSRGNSSRMTPYARSEEHTSELQSPMYLVCRLLLEKKKGPDLEALVASLTGVAQRSDRRR